jgi:hypothetical protein
MMTQFGGQSESFTDVVQAECFRGNGTILLRWRDDGAADTYILMRGTDGISGSVEFEEIYRGQDIFYLDADVDTDERYIYRLDKASGSLIIPGEETAIAVGNKESVDLNEPNNTRASASLLNYYKNANSYFFRFSDGRVLSDTDWYKVKVRPSQEVSIKIMELGAGAASSFYIFGPDEIHLTVTNDEPVTLFNNSASDEYIYFEVCPVSDVFVEPQMAGGTLRFYKIEIVGDSNSGGGGDSGGGNEAWSGGGDSGAGNESGSGGSDSGGGNTSGSGGSDSGGGNTSGSGGSDSGAGTDPGDIIVEASELFSVDDAGRITFSTNETRYKNGNYTFWNRLSGGGGGFSGISVDLVKESGYFAGAYGFFFREGEAAGYGNSMLTVLIQKDGNYAIGKVINGEYQSIEWWKSSDYLRKGYGVKNTVGVRLDEAGNEYVISINGIEVDRFQDINAPVCNGGGKGIIAVVTRFEDFPRTKVRTRYIVR